MLTPAEVLVFIGGGHLPVTQTVLGGPCPGMGSRPERENE